MDPAPSDAPRASAKPHAPIGHQIAGFVFGVLWGLGIGHLVVDVVLDVSRSPDNQILRFLLAIIGLLQFVWLLPIAFYGWRKRNVGLILGVLIASVPLIVLDAICFGPMYLYDQQH